MPHTDVGMYTGDQVRAYFDEYGEREWGRFEGSTAMRVNLEIHRRFLARLIQPGDRVLEVGAGPGRFTIQLAELGARVTVVDVSPGQLELNRVKVDEAGWEAAVEVRELADVVGLTAFADGAFDAATAYGGPLSYLFERAGDGLGELMRVTRPGGIVAFSVMSRWGTVHRFLEPILALGRRGLAAENRRVMETGELRGELARVDGMSLPHECHLFTWPEIEALLVGRPCDLLDASAAGFLSIRADDTLAGLSPEEWAEFLDWEEAACRSRGALDGGNHTLVALRRR